MKLSMSSQAPVIATLGMPGRGAVAALRQIGRTLFVYLVAYRQAQAATEIHAVLSRMSAADLARHGLNRRQISRHVMDCLGAKP